MFAVIGHTHYQGVTQPPHYQEQPMTKPDPLPFESLRITHRDGCIATPDQLRCSAGALRAEVPVTQASIVPIENIRPVPFTCLMRDLLQLPQVE